MPTFREATGTTRLRGTAAQCLALAQSTPDPRTRAALITMAQKLHEMANDRPGALSLAAGKTMPVFGNSFPFSFRGTFL
jgi:hypothetical protein